MNYGEARRRAQERKLAKANAAGKSKDVDKKVAKELKKIEDQEPKAADPQVTESAPEKQAEPEQKPAPKAKKKAASKKTSKKASKKAS